MNLFPINLNLRGQTAFIIGGGGVAERKCRSLLDAGAVVRVIAPAITPCLAELALRGSITHLHRPYEPGAMAGAALVFAATDDRAVNRAAAEEAQRLGIPVCVVDEPAEGTFTSPSTVRRGDLLITISTGGRSPALARRIREELEDRYGPEYADIVDILGAFREKLLTEHRGSAYNKQLFNELLDRCLPRLLSSGAAGDRDRLLRELSGLEVEPERLAEDTEELS
jgi:precorrin-2 dehydrogenase/sirohydrochlorin ferrochelatase